MVILERINHQIIASIGDLKKRFKKERVCNVSEFLDENLIAFLDVESRDDAIKCLIEVAEKNGNLKELKEPKAFHQAILDREKIVSTGIGIGVAVPHAKMEGLSDFFVVVGLQAKKGIDWNSPDGSLVRLIFMIGGPDNKQTEYLHLLSCLTQAIKNEEKRNKLLKSLSPKEVLQQFTGC